MKKRILALAVVLICVSIIATTTLAYFTDVGIARNVITTGGIKIELVEQQLVGDQLVDYPNEPIAAMPGKTVSKIVSAKSLDQPAWVRMCFEVTVFDEAGEVMDVPDDELEKLIVIATDGESWAYQDGWWYWNGAVNPGKSTAPLFEAVEFAGTMGNSYQGSTVTIDVTAQAVQAANNGESALDAAGWPED